MFISRQSDQACERLYNQLRADRICQHSINNDYGYIICDTTGRECDPFRCASPYAKDLMAVCTEHPEHAIRVWEYEGKIRVYYYQQDGNGDHLQVVEKCLTCGAPIHITTKLEIALAKLV